MYNKPDYSCMDLRVFAPSTTLRLFLELPKWCPSVKTYFKNQFIYLNQCESISPSWDLWGQLRTDFSSIFSVAPGFQSTSFHYLTSWDFSLLYLSLYWVQPTPAACVNEQVFEAPYSQRVVILIFLSAWPSALTGKVMKSYRKVNIAWSICMPAGDRFSLSWFLAPRTLALKSEDCYSEDLFGICEVLTGSPAQNKT